MAFSATEAAFEGFRVMRRHPRAVAIWGLLYLLLLGLVLGGMVAALLPLGNLGESPDPDDIGRFFAGLAPAVLLAVPILLLAGVVFYGAVFRAVLEPGESRAAFLRFGAAEMRLLVAYLVLILIWIAFVAACVLSFMVLGALLPPEVSYLLIFLVTLALTVLVIWAGVRLSLVLPISFVEGGVPLRRSWAMTRSRFWPLLGMWVLAFVFSIVISTVAYIVGMIVLLVFGGLGLVAQMQGGGELSALTPMIVVGGLLYLLIQLASAALQAVVITAPAAAAYRQLRSAPAAAEPSAAENLPTP
jgi:hypothetical protein